MQYNVDFLYRHLCCNKLKFNTCNIHTLVPQLATMPSNIKTDIYLCISVQQGRRKKENGEFMYCHISKASSSGSFLLSG